MTTLNYNGIIRGGVIRSMQVLGFGANPTPTPPGPTPLQVSSSVRFDSSGSAYISYTPTLQSDRTTWTWSGWVKRSGISTTLQNLFAARSGNELTLFRFTTSDTLQLYAQNSAASAIANYTTAAVFRDVSAWYHVLVAIDTTQATAANRVSIYINGVLQTLTTTTTVAQYTQLLVNTTGILHTIGVQATQNAEYVDGYLADMNFVDGQALTPSSFTETNTATGQIIPMTYAGSYGVNGFYLPFGNSATVAELGLNPKATGQDYPYWPYNTLLINSSSANGAQNNTFLDSSTNNFSITRNGNTTQGNFTPFNYGGGTAQTEGYYSGRFDGTGDYLSTTGGVTNVGTGDVCVEAWVYYTGTFSDYAFIFDSRGSSPYTDGFNIAINITNGYFYLGQDVQNLLTNIVCTKNTWFHVCATRQSGVFRLFVNGVLGGTYTSSSDLFNTTNRVGASYANVYFWNGSISNLRAVKGSVPAQYQTSSTTVGATIFLPPTAPLTNITNTSLLTCQSSQFIDNSANAFAITANGNAQPIPANPFGMTAWSGYFDGTGDYLAVNDAAGVIDYGTGDFNFEAWVYITGSATRQTIIASRFWLEVGPTTMQLTSAGITTVYTLTGLSNIQNAWAHIAVSRQSGTLRSFRNGILVSTLTSNTTNFELTGAYIGIEKGSLINPLTGYISNVRSIKGSALYTANFIPPTSPLTAISGTALLTCQSSTFIDNSPNAYPITVNGNSYTLTLNNPFNSPYNYTTPPVRAWSFGTTSAANTNFIATPVSENLRIDRGNWTIEFWLYLTGWAADNRAIDTGLNSSAAAWVFGYGSNGSIGWGRPTAGTGVSAPAGSISLNTWYHVVCTSSAAGVNGALYINGVRKAFVASYTAPTGTSNAFNIGRNNVVGWGGLSGYISNFRLVVGQQLYTSNFTPDTRPLTNSTYTLDGGATYLPITGTCQLLTCQDGSYRDNSINNFPLTQTGTTLGQQAFSPFIPTQAYSAASYGGSMYFDGTGDYLSVASNAAFGVGSGDFTVECWIYLAQNFDATGQGVVTASYNTNFAVIGVNSGAGNRIDVWVANANLTTGTNYISLNTWTHLAVVRSSGTTRIYFNGVQVASSGSLTGTGAAAALYVGTLSHNLNQEMNGYISNLRLVKGTALYTTPFVPPVLPLTNVSNTSVLLNATNSGIYDAIGKNVIETVGNAQVSTAVKKWGTSSVYFDGTGDYLIIPPNIQNYFSGAQTTGSNKDFTIEGWFYTTTVSPAAQVLVLRRSVSVSARGLSIILGTSRIEFYAGDSDSTSFNYSYTSSNGTISINTWYHFAMTRLGTTYRVFLNGVQLNSATPTAFVVADDTSPIWIGQNGAESTLYPFNGYMQDVRLTVGAARYQGAFTPPAAAFAYNQYDISNQQWTPTNISVTAGVGQDNLSDSPSDYGTDTGAGGQVRGNYATLNPLNNGSESTLSNGALDISWSATAGHSAGSTIAVSSGKWYAEFTRGSSQTLIGIIPSTFSGKLINWPGNTAYGTNSYGYFSNDGNKYNNSSPSAYGASYATGDVIGVALDLDAGTLVFYKNGVSQGVAYSSITGSYIFAIGYGAAPTGGTVASANFGQRAFAYAAPTGFKCLVSTNLPTPTIGATSTTQATDYFNAVLYTGTGATRSVTGVGFQPDLVWVKGRSGTTNHGLYDAVRGVQKQLESSTTTAETTQATGLTTFGSDGFTVGSLAQLNTNAATYVSWNWKANGAGVANTAGTIPSTVSASTTSGFSIVTYTSQSSGSGTIGHGLGVAPIMIINKPLTGSIGWSVYHQSLGNLAGLALNTNGGLTSSATYWNSTSPTTTVFSQGSAFAGLGTMVAYCFANVPGFSSLGSLTANSSADNAFVYTGFAPRFIMLKVTTAGATGNWIIFDTARNPTNIVGFEIYPNSNVAEANSADLDILSNGFKLRNAGFVSGTWIYAAFAEFPFKYARAR